MTEQFSGKQVLSLSMSLVKSGRIRRLDGLDAFCAEYPGTATMVVGSHETPLEDFLLGNVPLFA
ncbi:hypothetical protein [Bifidobacterium vespertilionis]|uniref:hypothetical protein n=1 Tax=Bifidobacterium vespertilionis TaxID=2562524 RepID=UPI001BDBE545|nr:hypothetical protein [Bifidobacterium vespertilionis]MBT1179913.1 hypothetical protein [Bifidobacterium vespertilionis]